MDQNIHSYKDKLLIYYSLVTQRPLVTWSFSAKPSFRCEIKDISAFFIVRSMDFRILAGLVFYNLSCLYIKLLQGHLVLAGVVM